MTEYERVTEQIAKIFFYEGLEEHCTVRQLDNIIDQILPLDGIRIEADDQTITIPCYQDGDMEKAEYIKAKPPSWITEAGFIRVIPKPKRK